MIGFDDIELASYLTPPLTTIRQNKMAMAEAAVTLLLERMIDPSRPARRHLLPTVLVQRQSTGRIA